MLDHTLSSLSLSSPSEGEEPSSEGGWWGLAEEGWRRLSTTAGKGSCRGRDSGKLSPTLATSVECLRMRCRGGSTVGSMESGERLDGLCCMTGDIKALCRCCCGSLKCALRGDTLPLVGPDVEEPRRYTILLLSNGNSPCKLPPW